MTVNASQEVREMAEESHVDRIRNVYDTENLAAIMGRANEAMYR